LSLKLRIVEGRKRGCSDLKEFGETDNFSNCVFFSLLFFKGREGEDRKYLKQQNQSKKSVLILHLPRKPVVLGDTEKYAQSGRTIFANYQLIIDRIPNTTPIIINAILPLDEEVRAE
jgi:hypothetical protein